MKNNLTIQRILLGLLMLVAGLLKLFVSGPDGVSGMLSSLALFSWAAGFWAWILIIGEIGSGIAILSSWKLKYTAYVPVIILAVAVLFMTIKWTALGSTSWSSVIFHLIAINGYLMLANSTDKKK